MHALVIEGGGMKASFANGVLSAFEENSFQPWDVVMGTSAGGALACWYSAKQARFAETTWEYAQDPRVLSWGRFFARRGPYLDHEALIDIVYTQEHPIDVEAIRNAPWPVIVTTIEAHSARMHYQDVRKEDIIQWIKATGRLPMMSGPPVNIDGVDHFDGGVADPIPIQHAVEVLGATEVTLISNNHTVKTKETPLATAFVRKYPALKPYVAKHQALKLAAMEYAKNPPAGVRVNLIQPKEPHGISRLSKDMQGVLAHLERGRAAGVAHINALQGD